MKGLSIRILGTVQGVGFRPFVANLALRLSVRGWVRNGPAGVEIRAAGERLDEFIALLRSSPPPLSRVTAFETGEAEVETGAFAILESLEEGGRGVDPSIDAAICDDCLRELFDPGNRRYHYPFINCVNCGPRFTLMTDLPFDRERTTLAPFPLCPDCLREYRDPADRRYHAQGTCCPACGPRYDGIDEAVRVLDEGGIAAIKGYGGYHLACRADEIRAVQRLRERKHRDEKPFALMVRNLSGFTLSDTERRLLLGPERPILLVDEPFPGTAAPGLSTLGIMLPYAPLHHLLFARGRFDRLIMTSGNKKSEPMAVRDGRRAFEGIADFVLDHNREIAARCDDSVVRVLFGAPAILRRARGFAPAPIHAGFDATGLLGCGAMWKNAVALGRGSDLFMSQHIGDLLNVETYESLAQACSHLKKMTGVEPTTAACDLHPDYLSTRFALTLGVPVCRVQHHKAHALSCMAEHGVDEALAVVYDGTGLGEDGHSWGGEIFTLTGRTAVRETHWSLLPLPGGDVAIGHPLRIAQAALLPHGVIFPETIDIIPIIENKVNLPFASGMGRLFDAAAALTGVCRKQTYEGQAPMMFEAMAAPAADTGGYDIDGLDSTGLLLALHKDTSPIALRAARFHNTVIEATAREVLRLSRERNIGRVVLSGGCFQNRLLLEGLIRRLQQHILVLTHGAVPANDGGLAVGQIAAVARGVK